MTASESLRQFARRLRDDDAAPATLRCVVCARRAAAGPWPDATAGPVCAWCWEKRG